MSLVSTVGIAKTGTKSLRTTVPEGIVAFLGVKEGDRLEWQMDIQNGNRVTIVKKRNSESASRARLTMKEKLDQKVSYR